MVTTDISYTKFDHLVALLRFRAALPYLARDARVCDIGCGPGAPFLRYARTTIALGVGLDHQCSDHSVENTRVVLCDISQGLPVRDGVFQHATMLAVLEHLADPTPTLRDAFRILAPGGSLILTWPSQVVDPVLRLLGRVRIVGEAMEAEQHQRRIPLRDLQTLLQQIGFRIVLHRTFELGLNHLLIASKPLVS
jgi:ubiquinone/menaquinone biosynthesis C-methylase UbiE